MIPQNIFASRLGMQPGPVQMPQQQYPMPQNPAAALQRPISGARPAMPMPQGMPAGMPMGMPQNALRQRMGMR